MAGFKTSARTLDLLGRQQIAGIPTAINELFKNAHDAYADYAEIDYFRQNGVFILRDNGLGMNNEDFENRWLTLGTDSKHVNSSINRPYIDSEKPFRYITGEKGIGRLSIASIGRQVLILSRAKNNNGLSDTVVAFIHWGVFELNGLNLEDIVIPTRVIKGGILPDKAIVKSLKDELINSIRSIISKRDILRDECSKIINEISEFDIIPDVIEQKLPNLQLSLTENGHGTHFYISPVSEMLDLDLDGEGNNQEATKIEKILMGFTNTMTPKHPQPPIELAFRDYKSNDGSYSDIINKDSFFSPDDFDFADHRIVGEFDEFGQFHGNVTVYQEKTFDHIVNWNGNNFRKTLCGPFKIDFAYVQGLDNQSVIPKEEYARIIAKCDKFGGLYIYNDNIRILPYGDSDFDFIDIEKNRTKSAKYYFFSFRRMFGATLISHTLNPELKEKAGREGFIENKAYRQMRLILKNFFVQLAADFFRENGGPKSEFWNEKRKEQVRISKALEKKEQQAKSRKEKFLKALDNFFQKLNDNSYSMRVNDILDNAHKSLSNIVYIKDSERASSKLLEIETETRQKLEDLKSLIKISPPKGFNINKRTSEDFEVYKEEFKKLDTSLFNVAERKLDDLISEFSTRLQIEISKRKRLELSVDIISNDAQKSTRKLGSEANEAANTVKTRVKDLTNQVMIDLEDKIRQVKDRFKNLNINNAEDFDLVTERKQMEEDILCEKEKSVNILESILKQLDGIYWDQDDQGDFVTNEEITQALQEKIYELEDRVTSDVELSQLGLAVGIIHHEFNSTVHSIRHSIKDLKAWADVNEKMESVYVNIRTNFEHLDSYLNMFTPLSRRLQRSNEDIPSNDIRLYVYDLFYPRFERHNIRLKHTKGFSKRSLFGYRSTFYPVFINIIDNAIHWVNQITSPEEKFIKLHADDTGFYISNNGPSILINEYERVFEIGYTRKPKGRGMGLHISREALNESGYKLYLIEPLEGCNVTFKIEKI